MKEDIARTIKELEDITKKQIDKERETEEKLKILFNEYCLKDYLNECEPAYCVFRITNSCEYIKILNKLYREAD